ncbi:MAG TPA: ABC transporter ATP-binding protein/permease [Candidatus Acetatifactor stercoripullorum]|uniref:ABC transporter ATP-binding protein/permease n=1 Tax=Candidatus Acetatifactor stercoripullorum TaxID=2838414 RepID=A0A9D1UAZ6_9FIRM|nr:ABC transporter ATP-binding protein [Candidatus Acetatifactor stercoripullorum]HIW81239.1 ABC transporter ATP-binding protein/permease [Candidatus Acetatifactor stercoripullorum]
MNRQDFKAILRLLSDFCRKQKKIVLNMTCAAVLEAVRPYITVVLMGFLLDQVYAGAQLGELLGYALGALFVNMLLQMLQAWTRESFNRKNEYIKEIEAGYLNEKALKMDYEYLEDFHVQELRFRGQNHSSLGTVGWMLYQLEFLITSVVSIFISLCILLPLFAGKSGAGEGFIASWQSAAILFCLLGAMIVFNYKLSLGYTARLKEMEDDMAREYNQLDYYMDILSRTDAQKDLRIYGQQKIILEDTEKSAERMKQGEKAQTRLFVRKQLIGRSLSDLSGLLVYLFTGLRAYAGVISVGGVVTYASSILQFSKAAARLADSMGYMKQVALYARDYGEYMDLGKGKKQGVKKLEEPGEGELSVEFEHVSFRYPGSEEYVLRDLNLKLDIGKRMAIVGKNGSGKTTFIKLLCGLYDVTEGCIRVNGVDIREYDHQEYCKLFSVVFQDFKLFSFPLGENIAGNTQADEGRVKDALERAGLGELPEKLEDGIYTYVDREFDDTGVVFSGGEKQKIAIARAIYKDAPFVIMDEPTAALDPLSECEVYAGFDKIAGGKTAIYISHRLASCRFCQDILVFDGGRVVQRGSHFELEKEEGLYREMWNAQAQYYQS